MSTALRTSATAGWTVVQETAGTSGALPTTGTPEPVETPVLD
jgi:hypothetical protein